ncbi:hypothetical protein RU94_GL000137 [Enterococcus asini]|nr:hypothetical protein RU94_GL000137 [Enterococcus asini]
MQALTLSIIALSLGLDSDFRQGGKACFLEKSCYPREEAVGTILKLGPA